MKKNSMATWVGRYLLFALLSMMTALGGLPASAADVVQLPASNRLKINLGATAWRYNLTDDQPANFIKPSFDDTAWPTTGIPHSPNESTMFTNWESGGGAGFMLGRVWYRKHFTLDAKYAGRKVIVEFEGAHTGAQVYINGTLLRGQSGVARNADATHVVGFLPFVVDLTPYVKIDGTSDNVIAVKTAINGDFFLNPDFSGGYRFGQGDTGLFRPVYMYVTDPVHIPQNVYATLKTWGTYVAVRTADRNAAAIHVETNILNESAASKNVTLTTKILDKNGAVVAQASSSKTLAPNVAPGYQLNKFEQELTVTNPTLWFPNNTAAGGPYMYRVFHIVSIDGAVVDATESPLGIRTIAWNDDYPLINGVPLSLWGGSGRYDYPALGTAVPEAQQWRDLQLLAAAGGSLYRPGHSSSSPEFVAAADALGIMLMQPSGDGENGFGVDCDTVACGQDNTDKQTLKMELHQEMIYRDRNNPSILAWEANNGVMNPQFALRLKALGNGLEQVPALNELPPVAPRPQSNRDAENPGNGDFLSCTRQSCEINLKVTNPTVPTWNAESWGPGNVREGYDSEIKFVASYLRDWGNGVRVKAFGLAQWYLADTPGETGEQSDGSLPANVRGLADSMMDQNRLPKLMYYAYQAAWTPYEVKPVVSLAHHWNRSGLVRVNAFSNCPAVRLKVNGVAQGQLQTPNPIDATVVDISQTTTQLPFQVHWDDVQWQAGTVTAECLDSADPFASVIASDERKTAGPANHLELIAEPGLVKPDGQTFQVTANGSDAQILTARVVDAQGVVVPTANNNITFAVSALGNYRGGTQQLVTTAAQLAQIGYLSAAELADYNNQASPNNQTVNLKMAHYHAPDSAELTAEGGLQRIAVRSRFQPGTVTVSATAAGLGTAQASFQVVAVPTPATQDGAAPVVVTQPAALLVSAGERANFAVTASGAAPLAFQWLRNGVAIAGATASSYTTAATTLNDNGSSYSVQVSNGRGQAVSNGAALQVVPPVAPAIVAAPQAITVPVGQIAKFTVQVSGSPTLVYQWLRNGAAIAGADQASFSTAAVTSADDGALYSVSVSNAVGKVTTTAVRLSVVAAVKPVFTVQPVGKVVQLGQSVSLSATATGSAPIHFEWKNSGNLVSAVDVNTNGPATTTLTIASVKASDLGNYTVEARNAANAANEVVASNVAALTQAPPGDNLALHKLVIADSFQDANGMPAAALTDGDTLTRWASAQGVDNVSLIIDLNAPETFTRMILRWEAAYATQYKIEVSNNKDDPASWKTIHSETQGTGQVNDFTFPSVSARYVRLTNSARATAYGYSLFEIEIYNVPGCGTGERYNVLDADNVLDTASGLTWKRRPYTLVEQGAQFTQPVAQAYCQNLGMRLPTRTEAVAIAKYNTAACAFPGQWNTWTSELVASDPNYAYTVASDGSIGQSLATNAPGSVMCVSGSSPVQAPAITQQPVSLTVAAGATAHFTALASGTNVVYNWYRQGVLVYTSSGASYDAVAGTADNGAVYYVVARNLSGEAVSQSVTLTVTGADPGNGGGQQPPGPVPSITSQPAGQTVAVGATARFTVAATGTGTLSYQWSRDGTAIAGATAATYVTPAVTLADNGASFTVAVGSSAGNGNVVSQPATLLVQGGANADTVNLALGKGVVASGTENATFGKPENAVDGDATSRWASDLGNDAAFITIDLGTAQALTKVEIDWEAAYGAKYRIEVSSNGTTYTPVYTQNTGRGGVEILSFPTVTARFIRMQGVLRALPAYGYSLFEFKVFGPKLTAVVQAQAQVQPQAVAANAAANAAALVNVALGKVATASGVENVAFAASNAVDGNAASRWGSNFADNAWLSVDLGAATPVSQVTLNWEAAFGTRYLIQTSLDGQQWQTVYTQNDGKGGVEDLAFATTSARFVRMQGVARATQYGYSLFEFAVYGSAVTTPPTGGDGDYVIYPGFIGVDLQNKTNGAWRDDQVYIAVIARNPANGHFSYLKPDGTIIEAQLTDNDAPGHLSKHGENYSNYFFTLADSKLLKIPKLDSGRIFVSLGGPLFIKILADGNGDVGFAGPNVLNPTDPNVDVYFDWYEFSYNDNGLWTNTTQVDQFGFPLVQDVYGANHSFHQQTGITEGRAAVFDAYAREMPAEFLLGEQSAYRILAPAKTSFDAGQVNGHYFDAYVNQIWDYYRGTALTVRIGGQKYLGRVNDADQFVFTEVDANTGAVIGGSYIISGKPTTQDIFEGKGVLANGNGVEKQIEAQLCAAFNRHVAADATSWAQPAAFYSAAPANAYAKFFHVHSVGGKAYGFAYDDVSDQSSTIQSPTPEHMVLGIGW